MLAYTPPGHSQLAGSYRALAALALAALLAALLPLALRAPAAPAGQPSGGMPLIIMPTGSAATPFSAFGLGNGVAFQRDGLSVQVAGERVGVRFLAARPDVALEPADRRAGTISRRVGPPSTWGEQIPTYAAVTYRGLYPGIDLRYDGAAGQLKGTYYVAPHISPAAIQWRYEGAERVAIDPASGDLVVSLAGGATLREAAPVAWQDLPGGRVPVTASFSLADGVAGFSLGAYDPAQPLVIDPTLTLGSYLGGGSTDYARGIAVDGQGSIYVVGDFFSSDFLGGSTPPSGMTDVIVLKLTPAGDDLVYGVYAGGSGSDTGLAIAVNGAGEAFVLVDPDGDFPLHNAAIRTAPAVGDGILMKLSAKGELAYSTYLGVTLLTSITGKAVAVGPDGRVYVTGYTYIPERRLAQVALVEVNPGSGAVARSFDRGDRYITTDGAAVAVGPNGRIYLTGTVGYPFGEFPTTPNAFQKQCGAKLSLGDDVWCGENAYLMVLSPALQVEYATYLGGSANDRAHGLAVDAQGNAIIVGDATSIDFPVKSAILPACPFEPDLQRCSYYGFATKLSPSAGLIYSTYIGSPAEPETRTFIRDVALDASGNAYVAGFSNASKLPVKNALQQIGGGELCGAFNRYCFDTYVLGLAPSGGLTFGTYLGGTLDEYHEDIAVDRAGAIYLAGYTESINFPTTDGSIQPAKSANKDFFVAKIAPGNSPTPTPSPTPDPTPDPTPAPELRYKAYLPLLTR